MTLSNKIVLFDNRWAGQHGIGRFCQEIFKRLPFMQPLKSRISPVNPIDPFLNSLIINKLKPSVFFTPGFNPPVYCPVPFIFTICDLNHLHVSENSTILKKNYYYSIIRPACRKAFRILTISEFSRNHIIEWAKVPDHKVVNVSCGASSNFCPTGAIHKEDSPYLLYVGNRKPHKNLPRLLDAYANSDVADKIKLLLSGDSDNITAQMIRTRNLNDKVIFAGFISESDLPSYYRGSVALLFPSLYEGFALPVLEAMACGTPVITSNRTAMPEVAGNACLLVDPENINKITESINKIGNDFNLRNKMRLLGLEQSKCFSWDKTAAKIKTFLEQASQGKEMF